MHYKMSHKSRERKSEHRKNAQLFYSLVRQSKEWAISQYGVKIDIPIFLNSKKTDYLLKNNQSGYMLSSSDDVPQKIVISKEFLEQNKPIDIQAIIQHEILHYIGWKLDKDFDDGDEWFENQLAKNLLYSNYNSFLNFALLSQT